MKSFIKQTIIFIFRSLSVLWPPSLVKKCKFRLDQFYTYWLSREFKSIGENPHIARPVYLMGGQYISIGKEFASLPGLRIECWDKYIDNKYTPDLSIGDNVYMNYNVHIGCINRISIGNNVLFASNIYISDHSHGLTDGVDINIPPALRSLVSKGPVIIKDNVWIGENVSIMPDLTIGKGCIIGANSVVTKSFPDYSIIAGVPAKMIRTINKNIYE
jgi:acetyltransferase-like isoleucine patch superfamily enzyme